MLEDVGDHPQGSKKVSYRRPQLEGLHVERARHIGSKKLKPKYPEDDEHAG